MLFPIGLLISAIFLIVTLATGFILPSNHHMLHWRCQTFYVSCLLVGDLLLAFIQMSQIIDVNYKGPACKFIGECQHVAPKELVLNVRNSQYLARRHHHGRHKTSIKSIK